MPPKLLARASTIWTYWPALLAWLALPLLILILPRGFHGNDDLIILETLRGGHPAPFLGDGLSLALAWLYTHVSANVSWYGLLLYLVTCASGHAGWRALQIIGNGGSLLRGLWKSLAAVILLAVLWSFSLHLTFTIVAMTAVGMGAIAFAVECRNQSLTWCRGMAYGLLIALGYQLRPAGGLATAICLGIPGLVFLLWFIQHARQTYATAFLAMILPIGLAVAANNLGAACLSPQEATYREYNAVRGALQGFDKYTDLELRFPEGLKAAGWDPQLYISFECMLNFNENLFSLEKISALLPLATPQNAPPSQWIALGIKMGYYCWPLLICALLSSFLCRNFNKRTWLGIAAISLHLLYLAFVFAGFAYAMRIVPRICMPMMLAGVMTSLAMGWWIMGEQWLGAPISQAELTPTTHPLATPKKMRPGIVGCLCLVFLSLSALEWLDLEARYPRTSWAPNSPTLADHIRQHAPQVPDQFIVAYGCIHGFSVGADPLLCADPMPFRVVYLEWSPPSPYFYDCLQKMGIEYGKDLIPNAYARQDILFLTDEAHLPQLEGYAQKELDHPVHLKQMYDPQWPGTALYRLIDGPSQRFQIKGYPVGSIFPLGDPRNISPPK